MDLPSLLVAAVYGLWLIATVVNSVPSGTEFLQRRLGPFTTIVPKWNFFSPHPGKFDFYLFYRDRRVDGSVSSWRKVHNLNEFPGWTGAFWNPYYFRDKVVFDVAMGLFVSLGEEHFDDEDVSIDLDKPGELPPDEEFEEQMVPIKLGELQVSIMYLTLLKFITEQAHSEMSEATQFLVMRNSRETEQFEPVFISHFHELDR